MAKSKLLNVQGNQISIHQIKFIRENNPLQNCHKQMVLKYVNE